MSSNDNSDDVLAPARQAERDLNSQQAKSGSAGSDSVNEPGVDTSVESKFPGASVTCGSAASGAGDNRKIPESEGGDILRNGRPTEARDFEDEGGPGDKRERERSERGGDNDI